MTVAIVEREQKRRMVTVRSGHVNTFTPTGPPQVLLEPGDEIVSVESGMASGNDWWIKVHVVRDAED